MPKFIKFPGVNQNLIHDCNVYVRADLICEVHEASEFDKSARKEVECVVKLANGLAIASSWPAEEIIALIEQAEIGT